MNFKFLISSVLAIALFIPSQGMAGNIVIIANRSVAESRLSVQDLKNIYLGKKTTWDRNKKIIFVTQDGVDISDKFLAEYLNMIPAQYSGYWLQKVFAGQGSPPKSFASDKETTNFVSQTEGAIGYVSSGEGLHNVNIIEVAR